MHCHLLPSPTSTNYTNFKDYKGNFGAKHYSNHGKYFVFKGFHALLILYFNYKVL